MKGLQRIQVRALVAVAGVAILFGWVTAQGFYGDFPRIKMTMPVFLWVVTLTCAVAGFVVRRRIADGRVGFDASQMQPVAVAQWLVFGQATAWASSAIAGLCVGVGVYVWPKAGELLAAQDDTPGLIVGAVSGVAAAIAGVWLERGCVVPPSDTAMPSQAFDVG